MLSAKDVIQIDPEILGGEPVFRGTRVALKTLFDYLETSSLEDFLDGFPSVTKEQAVSVIELSHRLIVSTIELYEGAS